MWTCQLPQFVVRPMMRDLWMPRTRPSSSGDHPVLVDEPAEAIGSPQLGGVDVADTRGAASSADGDAGRETDGGDASCSARCTPQGRLRDGAVRG